MSKGKHEEWQLEEEEILRYGGKKGLKLS